MSQPANPPSGLRCGVRAKSRWRCRRATVVAELPTLPPVEGRRFTYPPMFHPGWPRSEATTIDWDSGRIGRRHYRAAAGPCHRVSGTIEGPADTLAGLTVRLCLKDSESGHGSRHTALPDATGRFTFLERGGGRYIVDASRVFSQLSIGAPAGSRLAWLRWRRRRHRRF
jgi:hypothetical protein